MEQLDDAALVDLARGGDDGAFEALVRRHYDAVYRLAFRWCRLQADAEDITQDVFVKVARKLGTFRMRSAFSTWIYRVTVNTAKDHQRRRTARSQRETDISEAPPATTPAAAGGSDAQGVYAALDRLPAKQKAAVLLVLAQGLSHREAAEALGCSETTVSWRIFQARRKLKTALKGMV